MSEFLKRSWLVLSGFPLMLKAAFKRSAEFFLFILDKNRAAVANSNDSLLEKWPLGLGG